MYEELVKNLRENVKDGCSDCTETAPLILQAADAIEELQQIANHYEEESKGWWLAACDAKEERERLKEQIPRWIPATERLPEQWKRVLTYQKDYGVTENNICGDGKNWRIGYHITHWMPLPKPPKADKDGDR